MKQLETAGTGLIILESDTLEKTKLAIFKDKQHCKKNIYKKTWKKQNAFRNEKSAQ